ncbi:hypothetical protein INR49_030726 [Caranx melampygus]|nr:hypothetical protein INR49_030726 [Caranx melampygus]
MQNLVGTAEQRHVSYQVGIMKITVQLGFCGLSLMLALLREVKAQQLSDPAGVDCAWSRWTSWTSCDPCTRTRRRSRDIDLFGQFGGQPCRDVIGEAEACVPTGTCNKPELANCSDTEFRCKTGSCIPLRIVCNGDLDCEDASDEECTPQRPPCGSMQLLNNEQSRTAGYGINILGAEPRMNPFNNDYFNGRCERVLNPDTTRYDRIPWNIGVFRYETRVEETVSREIYETKDMLVRELMTEKTFKVDAGLSLKFKPSEKSMSKDGDPGIGGSFGANVGYDWSDMIRDVTENTKTQNKQFMRVKGKMQLSTYRMRSNDLRVADEFLEHLLTLPVEYEKGIYFAFLEDYGTHYTRNGKTGGEYELIYVLNQDVIRQRNLTERKVQECVKMGIEGEIGGVISGHVKPESCNPVTTKKDASTDGKAVVDDVMTIVNGGTLAAAAAMKAVLKTEGVMDVRTYQNWAQTISLVPGLLSSEPEPIYRLVPLTMPDANLRIANLKRATEDYIAQYNVCKCKPCQNGGTIALLDGKCHCLCPLLYEGLACQNFKVEKSRQSAARPPVQQEGNWSCWSFWSSCSGGKRTRSRTCNRGGITNAVCRGETLNDEYCN